MQPSRFWGVTRAYVSNLVNIKVAPDSKFEVGKIAANWALMLHTCRFPLGREFHHWWRGQSTEGLRNGWRLQMQKTNWSDFGRPCEDRWKMMKIHWPVYWCSLPIGYQALDICWPLQRKLRVSRSLRRTARLRWRSTNNRWGSQGFPVFPRGQENWQEFPRAFRFVPGAASEPIAAWSAENAADELCAREGVVMDGHGDGGANVGQFYLDH